MLQFFAIIENGSAPELILLERESAPAWILMCNLCAPSGDLAFHLGVGYHILVHINADFLTISLPDASANFSAPSSESSSATTYSAVIRILRPL
jgi:hypothetical protein